MKNWLIRALGGYTREDYVALHERYCSIPDVWDDAVAAMAAQDRVTILGDYSVLQEARIDGALIVAPRSYAYIAGCYSESAYLPVDSDRRIH